MTIMTDGTKSENEEKYAQLYEKLTQYEQQIHQKNQRRIKIGLKCFLIIPTCFLILLFLTGSNKLVFLILWIISLYALAFYLIGVEYMDYKLQQKLNEWSEEENKEVQNLISIDLNLSDMSESLRKAFKGRKQEVKDEEHN